MIEESELITHIWDRLEDYISNKSDKIGAAHQLLEVFYEMGHADAVAELAENKAGLDPNLSIAVSNYGDPDDEY